MELELVLCFTSALQYLKRRLVKLGYSLESYTERSPAPKEQMNYAPSSLNITSEAFNGGSNKTEKESMVLLPRIKFLLSCDSPLIED